LGGEKKTTGDKKKSSQEPLGEKSQEGGGEAKKD